MNLKVLLQEIGNYKIFGDPNIEIKNISDDSRKVKRQTLFVAIKGLHTDGHNFIPELINKGLKVVVGEKPPQKNWLKKIVYVKVPDSRKALSLLASAWHGHPSRSLKIIGVTGTKGKTTTALLIYSILKKAGKKVGVVTSNGAFIGKKKIDTGFHVTNPEPLALQSLLSEMVKNKCEYAVLEVTSHGLDQERVAGIKFDSGVFTNLSHEHLDYHKTLNAYLSAKAKLFKVNRISILNKDDSNYKKLLQKTSYKAKIVTYSSKSESDFTVSNYDEDKEFAYINIKNGEGEYVVKTALLGDYNALNIAASVAVARSYKVKWIDIQRALRNFQGIKGRLEKTENKKGINLYIDFAHTPNSLESVLKYLKSKTAGKLVAVFGSAGERDTIKRPLMGKVATSIAHVTIITAEDPRSEKARDIIEKIAAGIKDTVIEVDPSEFVDILEGHVYMKIEERGEAILKAIEIANPGDTVAVLGKGHEKSMAYNGVEYPWSDQKAIKMALKGRALTIKRN